MIIIPIKNRNYRFSLSVIILALSIGGCQSRSEEGAFTVINTDDPHSFARPWEVAVTKLALDLTVDFEQKRLYGSAQWDITVHTEAGELVLDINNLEIEAVKLLPGNTDAAFTVGDEEDLLGQPLVIGLEPGTRSVVIYYSTKPGPSALDWLEPAQTAGGEQPFLYTQSQPILARSIFPAQDTPAVRFPYEATISVPKGLMAVMSAENPQAKSLSGVYHFTMPQPIPSYLVALAVGDLEFKSMGPRTGVYAEPVTLEQAAWEFAETETMLKAAEDLYGEYRWGRYDLLILPPSFPIGGMENPRLTFVTPTVLAGDRSLTALIAHELAHSWSGNLVTNASWADLWLNEGFTSYFESRIMEKVYGRDYERMLSTLALGSLYEEFDRYGWDHPDSRLKINLDGRDPDSSFTAFAYDKGSFFLRHLEEQLGRENWDKFLAGYFNTYAFESMSTAGFVEYLKSEFGRDAELAQRLNIAGWIDSTGLPEDIPQISSPVLDEIKQLAIDFSEGLAVDRIETANWSTHHWLQFLRQLPEDLGVERMTALDQRFGLSQSGNSEILYDWLNLAILNDYQPAYPALESFMTSIGRMKFLLPLYMQLAATNAGSSRAAKIYERGRSGYHSTSWKYLDPLLGYSTN